MAEPGAEWAGEGGSAGGSVGGGARRPGSRGRRTGRAVRIADRFAELVISAGGLVVLAAMLGVCLFLFVSAAPLLRPGSIDPTPEATGQVDSAGTEIVAMRLDAGPGRVLVLRADGLLQTVDLRSGAVSGTQRVLPDDLIPTAWRYDPGTNGVAFGFADGSVATGTFGYERYLVLADWLPERVGSLEIGQQAVLEDEQGRIDLARRARIRDGLSSFAYVRRTDAETLEVWDLRAEFSEPISLGDRQVVSVDLLSDRRGSTVVGMFEDGSASVASVRARRGLVGSRGRSTATVTDVSFGPDTTSEARWIFLLDGGGIARVATNGDIAVALRGDPGDAYRPVAVRGLDGALPASVTTALGRRSLLVGDDRGRLRSFTLTTPAVSGEVQYQISETGSVSLSTAAVTALRTGERDRTVAASTGDGSVHVLNMTSGALVGRTTTGAVGRPASLALSPSLDRVGVLSDDGMISIFGSEPGFPEISFASLFGRVHYEGYAQPEWVYQSTGTRETEPKYSLVPLIFGTLKATIVTMLLAAPIAVLAAIYTSEFLHPDARRIVKPGIELMASLPSVVLGFIAAILVAPLARDHLASMLVSLVLIPVCAMGGAHLWRFAPLSLSRRVRSVGQLLLAAVAALVGGVLSFAFGPPLEAALFSSALSEGSEVGAFRAWLDGGAGDVWPGWLVLTVPLAAVVVFVFDSRVLSVFWADRVEGMTRRTAAVVELARYGIKLVVAACLAAALAWMLGSLELDARDSILGPFSQRNTLVVGLIMGIAVVPIIYTISEDAMHSVPDGLRSASLGSGATPWQTAVRVVLPVAGSGIFSACMIGLGRAVGETMIVLMATGNTPEISLNIFSGFRTLAANIAVELPEAPRGGTHYRVLFACGLTLFLMTLVINTTAELVRQRFRKRSASL